MTRPKNPWIGRPVPYNGNGKHLPVGPQRQQQPDSEQQHQLQQLLGLVRVLLAREGGRVRISQTEYEQAQTTDVRIGGTEHLGGRVLVAELVQKTPQVVEGA